jgi:hypothetical protein
LSLIKKPLINKGFYSKSGFANYFYVVELEFEFMIPLI